MSLVCLGYNCPKSRECGRYLYNLNSKYRIEVNTIENLASCGSVSISSDGIKEDWWCGPQGNYAMFEPLDSITDWHKVAELNAKALMEEQYKVEILEKALLQAVRDRNYLEEQIYLSAVDGGKLSVDYYIEQAKRRLNDESSNN